MTRTQCKELMPVLQAWAEGKEIQFRDVSCLYWRDVTSPFPAFQCESTQWRVKPAPREWWEIRYPGKSTTPLRFETQEKAFAQTRPAGFSVIHCVEVVE